MCPEEGSSVVRPVLLRTGSSRDAKTKHSVFGHYSHFFCRPERLVHGRPHTAVARGIYSQGLRDPGRAIDADYCGRVVYDVSRERAQFYRRVPEHHHVFALVPTIVVLLALVVCKDKYPAV